MINLDDIEIIDEFEDVYVNYLIDKNSYLAA